MKANINGSKINFSDYYRIRHKIEALGQQPTSSLKKHDHDSVTYGSLYQLLDDQLLPIMNVKIKNVDAYVLDVLSNLLSLLVYRKAITIADVQDLQKNVEKQYRKKESPNDQEKSQRRT